MRLSKKRILITYGLSPFFTGLLFGMVIVLVDFFEGISLTFERFLLAGFAFAFAAFIFYSIPAVLCGLFAIFIFKLVKSFQVFLLGVMGFLLSFFWVNLFFFNDIENNVPKTFAMTFVSNPYKMGVLGGMTSLSVALLLTLHKRKSN